MYGQPNYMNYYQPQFQPQFQPQYQPQFQPQVNRNPQPQQVNTQTGIQGKSVDSIDVVKAMDIPLDGTISYFPLTDGTAIVTKQLQQDGTSKTVVYKPVELKDEPKELSNYITAEDLDKAIKQIDTTSWKDELKNVKRQIKDMVNDIEDLKDRKD